MTDHAYRRDAAPTIVEFLNARLDELAHACRQLASANAHVDDGAEGLNMQMDSRWLLADIDSKRRMLAAHEWIRDPRYEPDYPGTCGTCSEPDDPEYPARWPCKTVRLLALPYAGHPDYRKEWAVE